jgi:hypothetical protein
MATSGTVGQTVFETRKIVDRAYRLCKVPPQVVTSEMLQTALDELYLILTSIAAVGIPLWCVKKEILPLYFGQITVPLPVGTVSVMQATIRDVTRLQGTPFASATVGLNTVDLAFDGEVDTHCEIAAVLGHIGLELDPANLVTTVGVLPAASGTWDYVLEYSQDGITYTTFYTATEVTVVAQEWIWMDFEELPEAVYWRIRALNTTVLDVAELVFANTPSEILMAAINKDDYFNLPNKTFQGKPLQYWQNRQFPQVEMKIWPASDYQSTFRQITLLAHRQIQDVGSLQQSLEMPVRWFDAISQKLGTYLAKVTPEAKLTGEERMTNKQDAEASMRVAWAEERDPSPINLAPDISMYTK